MRSFGFRFALILLFLSTGCLKRVGVDEPGIKDDQTDTRADAELDRVEAETATQSPERAAIAFEALARRLGDAPAAGEALYRAAGKWRTAKQNERAAADLTQFLTRFPLSPRNLNAKQQLAMLQIEMGRPRDGYQALTSLYDKLPQRERGAGAATIADAAEASRLWKEALRWRSEAAANSDPVARDKQIARAIEVVDGQLSQLEVARLKEELPSDSPLLPAVVMKLARIYVHLQATDQAESAAREELSRWPAGPYAADARALLDRITRRAKANANVIGVAVPMSGKHKGWGEAIMQGIGMAFEGSSLKIVVKDTRGEPEGAAQAMEALALSDGAIAALGAVTNGEAPRAAARAQEFELPLITLSKLEKVTEAGPFVFRNMLTASAQAKALADFAIARRGMKRFAALYPNIPYGQELVEAFRTEVEARGGAMRASEPYEHDRTTFTPILKRMVGRAHPESQSDFQAKEAQILRTEKDPVRRRKAIQKLKESLAPTVSFDAIFIPDFVNNIALVAPALAVEDVITNTCDSAELQRLRKLTHRPNLEPVQLLGANGWDDPSLVEKAGRYVECAVFVDGFYADSDRPETKAFVEAFQTKYQRPPSILEASAYDSARMIRRVLERGATTREALRAGLAGMRGFRGATGELSFDANREPVKPLFFLTVEKGEIRELAPDEMALPGSG